MKMKRIGSLVAGLAVAAAPMAGVQARPVAAAVDDVPDIMAPYVIGETVYDGGQPVDIDWGGNPPQIDGVEGVGRTSDGRLAIVVGEHTGSEDFACLRSTLWLVSEEVPATEIATSESCDNDDSFVSYGISDSGDRLYEQERFDYDIASHVVVHRLDGTVVKGRYFKDNYEVLDMDGNRLAIGDNYYALRPDYQVWTLGAGVRRVLPGGYDGADFGAGVNWRRNEDKVWVFRGVTDRSGKVLWKKRFWPIEVAADGRKILGLQMRPNGMTTGVVEVRFARTGQLVRSVRPSTEWHYSQMGWDGNNTIFAARQGNGEAWLVRCPMKKPCARAQDIHIPSDEYFTVFDAR